MIANAMLWVLQVLVALGFLSVAYGHAIDFERWSGRPGMAWLTAVGRVPMRFIGSLELLAAIGLILPGATGIQTWLTVAVAVLVVVLMILAAIYHAQRPEEGRNIVLNHILGLLAAIVAFGRLVVAPF